MLYDGCKVDEALPEGTGGAAYSAYDTGNVSFLYNDIFSITAKDGRGYSLVAEHFAMLAFEPSKLIGDHTYEELRDMPNGQLLEYLAGLTALTATDADLIENVEEDGHLRLETHYVSDQGERKINVVVVQFVFPDGSTQNVFAYSDDPEPIKNVTLND